MADRSLPRPIVNYAVNPSFEDGDPASYTVTTTFTGWTRGWGIVKGAAGDTVSVVQFGGASVDTLYGGMRAVQVVKVGTAGVVRLFQAIPIRLYRRFFNRQFTVGIRVATNAVGIARLGMFVNGALTFGPSNVKSDGTWETLYLTFPAGGVNTGSSMAFGLEMPGGAGTVNVDNVFLVDGPVPPSPLQYSSTPQTNGVSIWDSFQASADPKCLKIMGSGVTFVAPVNVTSTIPLNVAEVDTDRMGLTNGRVTINTDGKYLVSLGLLVIAASLVNNYFMWVSMNGGQVPLRGTVFALPTWAAFTNGGYTNCRGSFVDDFIAGDYLEAKVFPMLGTAGGSVTFDNSNGHLLVVRVGD